MATFKLRSTSGSALRDATNATLRGLDASITPFSLDASSSFLNLIQKTTLSSVTRTLTGSTQYAKAIAQHLPKALVASNTFNKTTRFSRLVSFANNSFISKLAKRTVAASGSFGLSLLAFTNFLMTLTLINSFVSRFTKQVPLTLTIPDYVDGGGSYGTGGLLDGGDESGEPSYYYDGSDEFYRFFIPSAQKNTRKSLVASTTQGLLLLTQALRFLSLSIISSLSITFNQAISKALNVFSTFTTVIEALTTDGETNMFYQALNLTTTQSLRYIRSVSRTIPLIQAFSRNIAYRVNYLVNSASVLSSTIKRASLKTLTAVTTAFLDETKQIFTSVTPNVSFVSNLFRTSFRFVALSTVSGFNLVSNKAINYTVVSSLSGLPVFQKTSLKTINTALSQTVALFTQSLRFVSLNLLSSLTVSISLSITKLIRIYSEFTTNTTKFIQIHLINFSSLATNLQYFSQKILSLSIQSTFAINYQLRIYKAFALFLRRYGFDNLLDGGYSDEPYQAYLDALEGGDTLEGNPIPAWILTKNVGKSLPLNNNYLTILINPLTKFVQLALNITSQFAANLTAVSRRFVTISALATLGASFNKIVNITIPFASSTTLAFTKQVAKSASIYTTFITDLIAESERFMMLALTVTSEFVQSISKSVAKSIKLNTTFYDRIAVVLDKTLSFSISNAALLNKAISRTLTSAFSGVSDISNLVARWLSLALVDNFVASMSNAIGKSVFTPFLNVVVQGRQISKLVSLVSSQTVNLLSQSLRSVSLNVFSSFALTRQNVVDSTVALSQTFNNAYQQSVVKLLTSTLNIPSQFTKFVSTSFSATLVNSVSSVKAVRFNFGTVSIFETNFAKQIRFTVSSNLLTTLDLTKFVAHWLSLAIVDVFDTSLTRLPTKFMYLTSQNDVTYTKKVDKNIAASMAQAVSMLTQSLRFVTFNLLTAYAVSRSSAVNYLNSVLTTLQNNTRNQITTSMNRLVSVNPAMNRGVSSSLNFAFDSLFNFARSSATTFNITTTMSGRFSRQIATVFTIVTTLASQSVKAISTNLNSFYTLNSNIASQVLKYLNRGLTAILDMQRMAAHWLSLAIVDVFDTNLVRLPNKLLSTTADSFINYRKQITGSVEVSGTFLMTLLTQTLRFVSLSILSSFAVTSARSISNFINVAQDYSLTSSRQISTSIKQTVALQTTIFKNLFRELNIIFGDLLDFIVIQILSGVTMGELRARFTATNYINKRLFKTVGLSVYAAINTLKSATSRLEIDSSLNQNVVRLPNKLMSATTTGLVNFQRTIVSNTMVSLLAVTSLFTQTLRFLSLAIISSFNLTFNRIISYVLSLSTIDALAISKSVSTNLAINVIDSIELIKYIAKNLSMNILSLFEPFLQVRVSRVLALILQRLTFDNLINGGSSSSLFDDILDAGLGSGNLDGNPIPAWIIQKNVRRTSILSTILTVNRNLLTNSLLGSTAVLNVIAGRFITNSVSILLTASANVARSSSLAFNLTSSFNSAFNVRIWKTIPNNLDSFLEVTRVNLLNINLFSNFSTSLVRLPNKVFELISSNYIASQQRVASFIQLTTNNTVTLLTQSLRFISLSILSNFALFRSVVVDKNVDATTIGFTGISRALFRTFALTITNTINLFTFTQRWVSLNIVDSFTTALKKVIPVNLNAALTGFSLTLSTLSAINLALVDTFTVLFHKLVRPTLTIPYRLNSGHENNNGSFYDGGNESYSPSYTFDGLNENLEYFITSTQKRTDKGISSIGAQAVNLFTRSLRFISLALIPNFATYQVVTIKKFIQSSNTFTANLFTRSLRFVYFSIINEFKPQFAVSIQKLIDRSLIATNVIKKQIFFAMLTASENWTNLNILVSKPLSAATELITVLQINVSKYLDSFTTAVFERFVVVAKALRIDFDSFEIIFTKRPQYVITTAFVDFVPNFQTNVAFILTATVETLINFTRFIASSISIAPTILTNISVSVRAYFNSVVGNAVSIGRLMSVNIRFATYNLFESVFGRSVSTSLPTDVSTVFDIRRVIAFGIPRTSIFNPSLLTQSLRFVYLSIVNEFRSNFAVLVNTLLTASFTTVSYIQRLISFGVGVVSSGSTQIIRLPNKLIDAVANTSLSVGLIIYKTIAFVSTNLVVVATKSLRFVTLALVNMFDAARQVSIRYSLKVNQFVEITDQRAINYNIKTSSSFANNFTRRIVSTLLTAFEAGISVGRIIAFTINLTASLVSTLATQSLRFITIAIINVFDTKIFKHVLSTQSNTFTVISDLTLTKNFAKLLDIIMNMPVRRSHTLYSALISFAVNKSKPGSEGSAQVTQRKSEGSTLFKRGKTDDLE